ALRRLELDTTTVRHADASVAHLWIESPTHSVEDAPVGGSALAGMFDTHPPLDKRIEALEQAGGFQLPDTLPDDQPYLATLGYCWSPPPEPPAPPGWVRGFAPRRSPPGRFARPARISPRIASAVSSCASAPISSPPGPMIRSTASPGTPASSSRSRRRSWFRR